MEVEPTIDDPDRRPKNKRDSLPEADVHPQIRLVQLGLCLPDPADDLSLYHRFRPMPARFGILSQRR